MAKEAVHRLLCRIALKKLATEHLAGGKGGVGNLQQEKTDQVFAFDIFESDNDAAGHGN